LASLGTQVIQREEIGKIVRLQSSGASARGGTLNYYYRAAA
jgi:hypothetical protein